MNKLQQILDGDLILYLNAGDIISKLTAKISKCFYCNFKVKIHIYVVLDQKILLKI